jgi:hypothetical protein
MLDLAIASAVDDVDAAVLRLQEIASIQDGGVCGQHFNPESWAHLTPKERIEKLIEWLKTEQRGSEE